MNRYRYEGLDANGTKVSGTLYGVKEDLITEIRARGIILTSITENTSTLRKGRYSLDDFKVNMEEVYHLLTAGVKLDQALGLLVKNTRKQSVKEFWDAIIKNVRSGVPFSRALHEVLAEKRLGGVELYINLVSVGEEIGDLKHALKNVMEHLEFRFTLRKEIRSAVAYPLFLVCMSIITVFFVCGFILPKFARIFSAEELGRLPFISKLTIGFGRFLDTNFSLAVTFTLAASLLLGYLLRSPKVMSRLRLWAYSAPITGPYLLLSDFSNLFSSLSSMLEGGVNLNRALKLSTKVVGSPRLVGLIEETNIELKKGNRISKVWSSHEIIPEDVISLLVVGENSARMGEIFASLSKRYLEHFRTAVARLLTLLEPMIIVLLGGFIAVIVVSIMLSVISMSDVAL